MRTKQTGHPIPATHYAFTLVELLVSVSIFAIIGVVLYSSFRGGVVSWRRINSEMVLQQEIRYALDRISTDFRNMEFLSNLPFEGTTERVKFVSLVKSSADQTIGIARVKYYLSVGKEEMPEATIVREEEPVRNALSLETAESETAGEALGSKEAARTEAGPGFKKENLLNGISELKFSYLVAYRRGGGPEEFEYEWVDFWEEEGLPRGIRIELVMTDPENKTRMVLSKRIYIPIVTNGTNKVQP